MASTMGGPALPADNDDEDDNDGGGDYDEQAEALRTVVVEAVSLRTPWRSQRLLARTPARRLSFSVRVRGDWRCDPLTGGADVPR